MIRTKKGPESKQSVTVAGENTPVERNLEQIRTLEGGHLKRNTNIVERVRGGGRGGVGVDIGRWVEQELQGVQSHSDSKNCMYASSQHENQV